MAYAKSKSTCLELAIEGERLCRAGDLNSGIHCFKHALSRGTDDLYCLSAIYCQLGNAYFCNHNYVEALEYHRWDLTLARLTKDFSGEAVASGNLGNTLKMLGKYDEATLCFIRQLEIGRQLENKQIRARALYNLGNVFQSKGKQCARNSGQTDPGEISNEAAEAQRKAVDCYKQCLGLVRELGDRPAEGRVYGNLGNTHYLLGNFQEAIKCHRERLNFANEFGDLAAQRRAYSNLGNASIFLADFASAANYYRNALRLAQQLSDMALEAQACYSLGNTYTVLRDPAKAVIYHLRHLVIARHLKDKVGEGRAHWSLSNAYTALGRYDSALRCARRHRLIARELHDDTGYMTAQLMIREVNHLMAAERQRQQQQPSPTTSPGDQNPSEHTRQRSSCSPLRTDGSCNVSEGSAAVPWAGTIASGLSVNGTTVLKTADKGLITSESDDLLGHFGDVDTTDDLDTELDADLERELACNAGDVLETVEVVTLGEDGKTRTKLLGCLDFATSSDPNSKDGKHQNANSFYSVAPAFKRRLDPSANPCNSGDIEEQLESIRTLSPAGETANQTPEASTGHERSAGADGESSAEPMGLTAATEEEQAEDQQEFFFSLLLNSQSRRMDEQRCCLRNSPGASVVSTHYNSERRSETHSTSAQPNGPQPSSSVPLHLDRMSEEAFFDLIEGVQGDRMDDQRASLPAFPGLRAGPGTQRFESASLVMAHNHPMMASTESGASDGLPEPRNRVFSSNCPQPVSSNGTSVGAAAPTDPATREVDDEFLELIFRLQTVTRIDDQRSSLPDPLYRSYDDARSNELSSVHTVPNTVETNGSTRCSTVADASLQRQSQTLTSNGQTSSFARPPAPTVPDEDFFALIQRVQSTRLDEQRCNPPTSRSPTASVGGCTQPPNTSNKSTSSSSSSSASSTNNAAAKSTSRRRVGSWRRAAPSQNR
ncbi:unnamed protein product [Calicophoron daubneyi]|uniref:G-protein-signaling modulator 2 n=1 Tax=Calicophoron daubneyi TaxID=300641 RepID=A0AAV2TIX8_CALDB